MTLAESRDRSQSRLRLVLAITGTYLLAEVAGGLWTGSLALLADAGHMLTDVGGLVLALLAMRFARRPATPRKTYGYHRIEILAAFANGVVLLGISAGILYEAYERFLSPSAVATGTMLLIGALGLVVNVVGVMLLRSNVGENLNMKGAYFELLSDLLSSLGVILAGIVMMATGWYWADPLVSAGIGLFIIPRTWRLLGEAFGVLMEGAPPGIDLEALRRELRSAPGVQDVHDLHVWTITSGMHSLTAHAVLAAGADPNVVREELTRRATALDMDHVTIQTEAIGTEESERHD